MKRKLLILSVVAICLASLAAGTLAYFNKADIAHNVITTGSIDIEINEWADVEKKTPFEDLDGIMPGQTETKIVEIKNTGASSAYIAVKVEKTILLGNGEETAATDAVSLDINTTYWTEKNGYYYYNTAVEPGELTEPIFTTVSFDRTMGNEYQKCTVTIDVNAYAVQSANNGTDPTLAKGWNWPAESDD